MSNISNKKSTSQHNQEPIVVESFSVMSRNPTETHFQSSVTSDANWSLYSNLMESWLLEKKVPSTTALLPQTCPSEQVTAALAAMIAEERTRTQRLESLVQELLEDRRRDRHEIISLKLVNNELRQQLDHIREDLHASAWGVQELRYFRDEATERMDTQAAQIQEISNQIGANPEEEMEEDPEEEMEEAPEPEEVGAESGLSSDSDAN